MNKLRNLLAVPALLLACAGAAQALEVTVVEDSRVRMPLKPISEEQRQIDLQLGNCLKANGGRMTGRCAELLNRSEQAASAAKAREEVATSTTTTTTITRTAP